MKRLMLGVFVMAVVAAVAWLYLPSHADAYTGTWVDASGEAAERGEGRARSYEVLAFRLPEHCDWQSAVALNVGWPLGTTQRAGEPGDVRQYIRDPENVTGKREGLDLEAELPAGSRKSGYTTGEVELWFGPDDGANFAYLVKGDEVERWPRPVDAPGCA